MHWLDIILLIPILWGLYKGFTEGFIKELISFIAFGIALLIAVKLYKVSAKLLVEHQILSPEYANLGAFCAIVILVIIALFLISKALTEAIKAAKLNTINQVLGALFGALKWGMIFAVLLYYIEQINQKFHLVEGPLFDKSILYAPTVWLVSQIFNLVKSLF